MDTMRKRVPPLGLPQWKQGLQTRDASPALLSGLRSLPPKA